MQKIEYGDLYKFLVSVGVILIGFAVLIPYFYLKEDFGLCVPQSDMARFEPEVRQIIRTKQQLLLRVQNYVPYLSLAMFATGAPVGRCGTVQMEPAATAGRRQVRSGSQTARLADTGAFA